MKSYEIKSFRGGISDYEDKGIAGSFKFGKNLDIRKKVDSLSCQQALASEGSGVVDDLILFFVQPLFSKDVNLYGFSYTDIYKRTPLGAWSVVHTAAENIDGAAEWHDNTGKTYLYWTTGTELHRKELPGASDWSDVDAGADWPKTNLTTGWHTMKQANGALMICNDQYLAMVGYDNSYTNQALDLVKGRDAISLVEYDGNVLVGTAKDNYEDSAELYLWEQTALSWIRKKEVSARGVNSINVNNGMILVQAGTAGQLFQTDLVNSLQITSFPGGGQTFPDATLNSENLSLFGVYGNGTGNTGIYSYGRKNKNHPMVLNLDYQLDCTYIGSVAKVGSTLLFSYKSGSTYGVKKVDTSAKATAVYESLDLKAPLKMPETPTVWQAVELFTAPMPSGAAVEVWFRVNKTGNFVQALMEGGVTQFTTTNAQKAVFLVGAEGEVCEVQIKLIPSSNNGPEVYKAVVYFD